MAQGGSADQRLEKLSCNCGEVPSPALDSPPRSHTGKGYDNKRMSATRERASCLSPLPKERRNRNGNWTDLRSRDSGTRKVSPTEPVQSASQYRVMHSCHECPAAMCALTRENILIHVCAHHTYTKIEKEKMSPTRRFPRMRGSMKRRSEALIRVGPPVSPGQIWRLLTCFRSMGDRHIFN